MNTHEVPPSDWNEFLRSFSRRYENWLVQLETIEMSGHLLSSRQLRLKSIAAETEGTTKTILLQGKATDTANTISDLIRNPAKVTVTETAEGLTESLQITTPTNTVRIQFRSAAVLPELVDGIILPHGLKSSHSPKPPPQAEIIPRFTVGAQVRLA